VLCFFTFSNPRPPPADNRTFHPAPPPPPPPPARFLEEFFTAQTYAFFFWGGGLWGTQSYFPRRIGGTNRRHRVKYRTLSGASPVREFIRAARCLSPPPPPPPPPPSWWGDDGGKRTAYVCGSWFPNRVLAPALARRFGQAKGHRVHRWPAARNQDFARVVPHHLSISGGKPRLQARTTIEF